MVQAVDNSEGTSSLEMKKQIMEQTQAMLDAVTSDTAASEDVIVEPDTEETETTEQTEGEDAQETETKEEETTEEVETPPKKTETLHKLKVEGKEEEWPYEKVIAFAQQGRFLEKEKQRLNEERRKFEQESKNQPPNIVQHMQQDPVKAKEAFFNALAEDPFSTLGLAVQTMMQNTKQQEIQEKKTEREFISSRKESDPDTWDLVKPSYEQYREEGMTREQAYLMAENDLLRKALTTAKQKGLKEGQDKAKLRSKAEIPTGAGKSKVKGKTPTPDEFKKMSSAEMKKHLPRAAPHPDW
jgi:hypothetical protein